MAVEFEGLFQNKTLLSKKVFCVIQQGHRFSNDSFIFEGTELIFHGVLGWFGGKISFVQWECWSFWLQAFCKTVLWAFFPAFGNILAFGSCFFLINSSSTWKIDFSICWQSLMFLQQVALLNSKDSNSKVDGRNWFFQRLL